MLMIATDESSLRALNLQIHQWPHIPNGYPLNGLAHHVYFSQHFSMQFSYTLVKKLLAPQNL